MHTGAIRIPSYWQCLAQFTVARVLFCVSLHPKTYDPLRVRAGWIRRNKALQEGRAPRAPNACAWVAYTASKKRHGLLQAACTSMVKECSQNGVGCHDSYHVYHLRYRLIRMAQMLLACALLHVTQLNMQREVLFQCTRCLSDVLQNAAARARCSAATGYPRHTPYAALARPQQCRKERFWNRKSVRMAHPALRPGWQ